MTSQYHAYSHKKTKPGSIREREGRVSRSEARKKVLAAKRETKKATVTP